MSGIPDRLATALADRYRIERELGAGGMAIVYLAEDLRHKRRVAIKVLKPDLAAVLGAGRFVTEITTTAALQHPHILPLFDSGTAGERDGGTEFLFYVMPYIEGETLRTKLDRERQLGIDEAVRIAREVADALDYAHGRGVVHRDIKPENILLANGRPMVADFGIALAVSAAAGGRMTETGLSLGTPHYMSPEQATAEREITARSDIYSLGCVLYEMLAGDPPHTGATVQQIIMKIVTDTPRPVTELRKSVPPNVADAVATALEKLPADRFAGAAAFAEALGNPAYRGAAGASVAGSAPRSGSTAAIGPRAWDPRIWPLPARLVAAMGIVLAGYFAWLRPAPEPPLPPVLRFVHAPEGEGRLVSAGAPSIALSPDGTRIVYTGETADGERMLYLRHLSGEEPRPLPGTDGASMPFFSPDGRHIGFVQGQNIRRLSLDGGAVTTVSGRYFGPFTGWSWDDFVYSWHSDGFIYLVESTIPFEGAAPEETETRLIRVPATGGAWEVLASERGSRVYALPDVLPDGSGVLVTLNPFGEPELAVISLPDGRIHELGEPGLRPRWVEGGYITFLNPEGRLMAAPFDARRRRLSGRPVPMAEGIEFRADAGASWFGVARNGAFAFMPGDGAPLYSRSVLIHVDAEGRPLDASAAGAEVDGSNPRFSPDGRRIVVTRGEGADMAIWVLDLQTRVLTRLTADFLDSPTWLADGRRVAYTGQPSDPSEGSFILAIPIDGSAPPDTLARLSTFGIDWRMAPNERFAVYRSAGGLQPRIWRMSLEEDGTETPLTPGTFRAVESELSPDGAWLAYRSDETGSFELYLRRASAEGGRWLVPSRGALGARWSADGRELMYLQGDTLYAVPLELGAEPSFGAPRALIARSVEGYRNISFLWDVSPDRDRYVFAGQREGEGENARRMVIMLNWLEHARREGR